MIPHPVCFARWIWRSLRCGAWVEGHDYVILDEPTPENVQVLRCERCGEVSVAWDWGPIAGKVRGAHVEQVIVPPEEPH